MSSAEKSSSKEKQPLWKRAAMVGLLGAVAVALF